VKDVKTKLIITVKTTTSRKKPLMPRNLKAPLVIQNSQENKPLSGVGPGVALKFVQAHFVEAEHTIRIASAYFTLQGYKLGRNHISSNVKIQILVGKEEGHNVQATVIDEIIAGLGQCETDIWETVFDLVERMKNGHFIIRDAREMKTRFHSKFYICDNKLIWHGSANYTGLGLNQSAEQVSISRNEEQIALFTEWYDKVAQDAKDLLAELIARLEAWLNLAKPFEVYLKTLLLLNNLPDYAVRGMAYPPAYYQKGVIARALRQSEEYGGALIVAATGLGKTIIGAEIALHLISEGKIKRVILIAPNGVRENWEQQLEGRDIYVKFFNIGVLFLNKPAHSYQQIAQLEKLLKTADENTAIIIDEVHFYRNQLLSQRSKGRKVEFMNA
jgi:hypothetical protein